MKTARRGRDEARRERECQEGARDPAADFLLLRRLAQSPLLDGYGLVAADHMALTNVCALVTRSSS